MSLGRIAAYSGRYATERPAHSRSSRGRDHQRVGNHSARRFDSPVDRIPRSGLCSQTAADGRLAVQRRRARRRIDRTRVRPCLSHFHRSMAGRNSKLSQSSHRWLRHGSPVDGSAGRCTNAMVNQPRRAVLNCDTCCVAVGTHQRSSARSLRNLRVDQLRRCAGRPIANTHQTLLLCSLPDARTSALVPLAQARIANPNQVRPTAVGRS